MGRKVRGYWTIDKVREEALKFNKRSDFKEKSINAFSAGKRNGWLDDVCCNMILGKMPSGYWTIDKVKEEALKFNKRSDFKNLSSSAYSTALRNGWLDDVCLHMTKRKLESFKK